MDDKGKPNQKTIEKMSDRIFKYVKHTETEGARTWALFSILRLSSFAVDRTNGSGVNINLFLTFRIFVWKNKCQGLTAKVCRFGASLLNADEKPLRSQPSGL